MKVSVSVLSSKIKPADITKKLDSTCADYIHLDIMDGKFTENKTWTFSEVKKIISYSKLPLDVHLMVNNPEKYKGINERETILAPMVYWNGDTDDPIVIPECDEIFVHEKREKVKPYTTQQCKDKTRMERLMERLKQYK